MNTNVKNLKIQKFVLYALIVLIFFLAFIAIFSSPTHAKFEAHAWIPPGSYSNHNFTTAEGGKDPNSESGSGYWGSAINKVGSFSLHPASNVKNYWGVAQSYGQRSDYEYADGFLKLNQGASSGERFGVLWLTIPISDGLSAEIAAGNVKMKFSCLYANGDAGGTRETHAFIAWGSGGQGINSFTTIHGVSGTAKGGGVKNDKPVDLSVEKPYRATSGVNSIRVGVNGRKDGTLRHLDIFIKSMKLEIWVNGANIKANDETKYYGNANPEFGYTPSNVLEGDSVSNVTYSTAATETSIVGSYAISIASYTITNSTYYNKRTTTNGTLTVNKRPVTVTADAKTKVYGQANPTAYTFTHTSLGSGIPINGTPMRSGGEDVGGYNIGRGTIMDSANSNYIINFFAATFTITKKPITVTATDDSKTYGDADPVLTFSPNVPNETIANGGSWATITGVPTRDSGDNVGTYTIRQNNVNHDNYEITFITGTFTINKRAVTVTVDAEQSKVYCEANPEKYTFAYSLLGSGVAINGALTRVAGENVGEYEIQQGTMTNANNPNYTITYVGAKFTINRFDISVIPTQGQEKIYGDADPANFAHTKTDIPNGGAALSGTLGRTAGNTVGRYVITLGTLTNANNANYNITLIGTVEFEIKVRPLTIRIVDKTSAYEVALVPLTFAIQSGSMQYSEADSVLDIKLNKAAGSDAGDYQIVGSQGVNKSLNYVVTFTGSFGAGLDRGKYTITKINRSITTTGITKDYEYNGLEQAVVAGAILSRNDEAETGANNNIVYSNNKFTNVPASGKHTITLTNTGSTNFNECTTTFEINIERAVVTVTIDDKESIYNSGSLATLTATHTALKNFENVNILKLEYSTDATASSNAGTYTITGGQGAGMSQNYTVVFTGSNGTTGKYIIKKAVAIVTRKSPAATYTYSGVEQTITDFNLNNSEGVISYSSSSNKFTDVPVNGEQEVKIFVNATTNYLAFAETSFVVTIAKAVTNISIAADKVIDFTYNGSNQTVGLSGISINHVGNFISAINLSNASFKDVPTTGKQTVTVNVLSNQNYLANTKTFEINIAKASLGITIANETKVYGQVDPTFTSNITSNSLLGTDTVSDLKLVLARNTGNNVGSYDINATYTNGNYNITFAKGTLSITAKTVVIQIANVSIGYNKNLVEPNDVNALLSFSLKLGNNLEYNEANSVLDIKLIKDVGRNVGTYAIRGSQGVNKSNNYTVVFEGASGTNDYGNFVITKGTRTISTNNIQDTYEYNGEIQTVTGAVLSIYDNGEDESIITSSNNSFKDVPSGRKINILFEVAETINYFASFKSLEITVNPRTIKIHILEKTSVYGEPLESLEWEKDASSSMVGTDDISILGISVNSQVAPSSDAGTYRIYGKAASNLTNYAVTFSGTFEAGGSLGLYTIKQAEMVVDFSGVGTYTYNGAEQTITGISVTPSHIPVTYTNIRFTDVPASGILQIGYASVGTKNYKGFAQKYYDVTINKATSVINTSAMQLTYTYSGYTQAITSGATINHVGNHVSTLSYSNNIFKNVPDSGKILVNIAVAENANYLEAEIAVEVQINKANLSVDITNIEAEYGDAEKTLSYTLASGSSLLGSDTLASLGITLKRDLGTSRGTYPITKDAYTTKDYNISFNDGVYTITPKTLIIIIADKESVYGESIVDLEYNLASGYTLVNPDTLSVLKISLSKDVGLNAGTYAITATQGDGYSQNYIVEFSGSYNNGNEGKYTISKATRYIDTSSVVKTYTYNGEEQTVSGATLSDNDATGGNELVYSSHTFTNVPATGKQMVTITNAGSTNYTEAEVSFEITINKFASTIIVNDITREYKDNASEGYSAKLDANSSLAGSETIATLSLEYSSSVVFTSNAGTYQITASSNNQNYALTITPGTYTITKAAMTISANAIEVVYGQSQTLDFTMGNALKQDDTKETLAIVLSRGSNNNVGTYPITLVSKNDTNYDITYNSANYVIVKKAITVNIPDKSSVYAQPLVAVEANIDSSTPLAYSENSNVLDISVSKADGINAGEYNINASQGANASGNYQVSFVGSKGQYSIYTISQADTIIDISNIPTVYTYNNTIQTINSGATINHTGLHISSIEYSNNTFKDVPTSGGNQTVTISVLANNNYFAASKDLIITVNKATTIINVSGVERNYTYNGLQQTVNSGAFTNRQDSSDIHISYSQNTFTNVPDSGKQIVIIGIATNRNYTAASTSVEIYIDKADTVIDVSNIPVEYTYNRKEQTITGATINRAGDISYTNNIFTEVPASGNQQVTISVEGTTNYKAAEKIITVTIKKALQEIDVSKMKIEYESTGTTPITIIQDAFIVDDDNEQTIVYSRLQYTDYQQMRDYPDIVISVAETTNYLANSVTITLLVDQKHPIINVSGVIRNYVYTGLLQTIDSGAILEDGGQNQSLNYSNNTFTTVEEGNGLVVSISVDADGAWVAATVTVTIVVEKATTTITVDQSKLNFTYTGAEQVAEFASINHSEATISYLNNRFTTVADGIGLEARAYTQETANYKSASIDNVKFTVAKADTIINLATMTHEFTYTGSTQYATGATINHNEVNLSYINNGFRTVAEGNGKIAKVIANESSNYKYAEKTIALIVHKATYDLSSINFSGRTVDYNGEKHSLAISGTLPAGVSVSYSKTNLVRAGSYSINASFAGDHANYNIVADKTASLIIEKIEYDFSSTIFVDAMMEYNGKYQTLKMRGTLPVGYDDSSPVIEYTGQIKDVGSIDVVANISSISPNYKVSTSSKTATLTIFPAKINVASGNRYDSPHDQVDVVSLDASNYRLINVAEGDSVGITYTAAFVDKTAVGAAEVEMTITAVDNANYKLPQDPYVVRINAGIKYPIELSIQTRLLAFDNTAKQMPVTAKIAGQNVPYTVSFSQGGFVFDKAVNAGIYRMHVKVVDEYAGERVVSEDMKINQVQPSVVMNGNFEQEYGSFEKFSAKLVVAYDDGSVPEIKFNYSFSTLNPGVGTHSVTADFSGSTNYSRASLTKEFTVSKRKINLLLPENNKYPYLGISQTLRYQLSSQAIGDKDIVTLTYGEDSPKNIGIYEVHSQLNNDNYIIENVIGPSNIEITRAKLNVFVKADYGVANKPVKFSFEYEGFVGEDDVTVLTSAPRVEKNIYKAGKYQIEAIGAEADSYEMVYVPFNLHVYQENISESVGRDKVTVTGLHDSDAKVHIKQIQADQFFNTFFRVNNEITNAYRVEVVGEQDAVTTSATRKIMIRNEKIKSNIFAGAYFIDNNGKKTKISRQDIKNGYVETSLNSNSGYIVVYRNNTIWFVIGGIFALGLIIFIIHKRASRSQARRVASKYTFIN